VAKKSQEFSNSFHSKAETWVAGRTAEIGLALAAGGRLALNSSWSMLFGAGAALVRTDADLQARDCFDEDTAAAGCQPINIPGLPVTSSSATASRSGVGGRVDGRLGVRFRYDIAPSICSAACAIRATFRRSSIQPPAARW
jgi:hypothetical protein